MIEYNDEITEIIELDERECIDIEVSNDHLFYANDILTKNSTGLIATCDFAAIFGTDEDNAVYENEIFYKLVKNRFGGRVGDINKFYIDLRNLKMYDVQEQNLWFDDIKISNDERKMVEVRPDPIERNRGRRTTTRR
jgi:hypothetical protein